MTTLQTQWEMYERSMIPSGVTSRKRQEIKRAFVAGMTTMIDTLEHTPDDSEQFIMEMAQELDEMAVETGYA